VSKLYYAVVTEDVVAMMSPQGKPASVMMDGVPFPMVGYRRDQLSAITDVGQHVQAKLRGLTCHATQFDASGEAEDAAQWLESLLFREETYLLGRSTVGTTAGVETDLFRGLS
jgi:LmbE family N-acetylglucosaminyl deacetylase